MQEAAAQVAQAPTEATTGVTAEVAAGAAVHHENFLADPHAWVLFSFIAFVVIAVVKGKKPLLAMLDTRTARIKADLEEAARLKAEAEALLSDYRKKHSEAVVTAQKIIETAQESVALMQRDAEAKLTENLQRREELLLERIARAESAAVQELRHQAADIAARAAEQLLSEAMDKNGARLVNEAIEELPQRAHG
jgi:F-type H+-transporting ATPase subunit b